MVVKYLIILFVFLFLIAVSTRAQIDEFKLFAGSGNEYGDFGVSVSISGDYVIVGDALDDDNGKDAGSAYIFRREGSIWIEEQKLKASDGDEDDRFGISVSISGDYAIVGAYVDEINGLKTGSAYIFRREGAEWIEKQKLVANDGAEYDWFGFRVSISGDYAVVGAQFDDDNGVSSGSAYIFKKEGSNWAEVQKLTASDGSSLEAFGISVSISGDNVIIGAYEDDDNGINSGSAYIFERNITDWAEKQKLTASDGSELDGFGVSVSISGEYAIVGSYYDDDNGPYSGSVYIFKREGLTWQEKQKITANDGIEYDEFGFSSSISGDYIVVGAHFNDEMGWNSGSAYIFKREGSQWIEERKLSISDSVAGSWFGFSVSMSGDCAVVGAPLDENEEKKGSAYVFCNVVEVNLDNPTAFVLSQNYPNPFNPTTKIKYQIPELSFVTIKVYDVLGNEIATLVNEEKPAGSYELEFSVGRDLSPDIASGIYFYRIQSGNIVESKKMILMK